MKFTSKKEALLVQDKLIEKLESKEKEVIKLKKGILKINSIVAKYTQAEKPYIVETHVLKEDSNTLINYIYFKDEEEARKYVNSLKDKVIKTVATDFAVYLYKHCLDSEMNESYILLEFLQHTGISPNPNFIFYNIMLLKKVQYNLSEQQFLELPFIKEDEPSMDFSNISDIFTELSMLIKTYDKLIGEKYYKDIILNSNSEYEPSFEDVKSIFEKLSSTKMILSLEKDVKSRSFQLNEMFENTDNLEDIQYVSVSISL